MNYMYLEKWYINSSVLDKITVLYDFFLKTIAKIQNDLPFRNLQASSMVKNLFNKTWFFGHSLYN